MSTSTPEEHLSLQRSAEAVRESLGSVADWQAEVFVLRHMENLPIGEIATRMSRSHDSIRSSLYRVKRLVVEAMSGSSSAGTDSVLDAGTNWWEPERSSAHVGGGGR